MSEEPGDRNENNSSGAEESIPLEIVRYAQPGIAPTQTQDIIDVSLRAAAENASFEQLAAYKQAQESLKLEQERNRLEEEKLRQQEKLIDNHIKNDEHKRALKNEDIYLRKFAFLLGIIIALVLILAEVPSALVILALSLGGLGASAENLPSLVSIGKSLGSGKDKDSDGK
jgi:hypothetical protein